MNHMFIIISFNPILHASSFHLERFDSNKHISDLLVVLIVFFIQATLSCLVSITVDDGI